MENGYLIIGIIALLFLCMYAYAYLSVELEKVKQTKKAKTIIKNELLRRHRSMERQKIIDEKVRKFKARKEQIQRELMFLEQLKSEQQVS